MDQLGAVKATGYARVSTGEQVDSGLAEYMGHSDPGYLLRVYTHLMPTSEERARTAIDGLFNPAEGDEGEVVEG
jgi:hypothetical protein